MEGFDAKGVTAGMQSRFAQIATATDNSSWKVFVDKQTEINSVPFVSCHCGHCSLGTDLKSDSILCWRCKGPCTLQMFHSLAGERKSR